MRNTNTDAFALQQSDLNGFLFAEIGIEASGMTLSVVSALARLGLDPWQEAKRLAKLPRATAVDGLARIIAAMPASLWPLPVATTIAARLVALLPRHDGIPTAKSVHVAAARFRPSAQWLIILALLLAVLAGVAFRLTGAMGTNDPASATFLAPLNVPPVNVPTRG